MHQTAYRRIRSRGRRLTPIAFLLASAFPAGAALAADATASRELDEVRIAATRANTLAEDSARALSVIDSAQIAERPGASGVQALLAEVPGIAYARSGGLGGQIVMRGFNSNTSRSMLAIDGDRYRGRNTLELNMLDPNAIERIEIIRGPASALWGADAMNGVVNVVTRRARVDRDAPFALDAKLRAIEYNSVNDLWATRAELVGGGNGFDVLVGAHLRDADDYETPKGTAENSRFKAGGVDFRIGWSPNADTRWELAGRYQDTTTGRAGGLGAAPGLPWLEVTEDPIQERYLKIGVESRKVGAFADLLEGSFYVRKFETDIHQKNATTATGTLAATTVNQLIRVNTPTVTGGRLNATKGLGAHTLAYGFDFFKEDFDGRTVAVTRTTTATGAVTATVPWKQMERGALQTNHGFFLSDDWQIDPAFALSGALRWDHIRTEIDATPVAGESAALSNTFARVRETTDKPLTGSLGGVFKFAPAWSATAQISRGFRAPAGMDRTLTSTAGTIVTLPSPDLEPEHSTTAEIGLRFRAKDVGFNATAYRSKYKDLILLAVVDATTRQRRNVGSAEITGLEIDGDWRFARNWTLRAAAAATRGTDTSSDTPLEGVPEFTLRLAARYGAEGAPWHAEGVLRAATERDRVNTATERPRAGYGLVDVYVGADLGKTLGAGWKNWKFSAGVENLFDRAVANQTVAEDLRYPAGLIGNPLLEPGRALVVKLVQEY